MVAGGLVVVLVGFVVGVGVVLVGLLPKRLIPPPVVVLAAGVVLVVGFVVVVVLPC